MSESELPIQVTLVSTRSRWLALWVLIASVILMVSLAILWAYLRLELAGMVLAGGVYAYGFLRGMRLLYRRHQIKLVLDNKGIWLHEEGMKGITWPNVAGYAISAPPPFARFLGIQIHSSLRVWDTMGYTLEVPGLQYPDLAFVYEPVLHELGRRVGPSDDRPASVRHPDALKESPSPHRGRIQSPLAPTDEGLALRLRVFNFNRFGFPLGMALLYILFAAALLIRTRDLTLAGIAGFGSLVMIGYGLSFVIRFRGAYLVLDESGIWVERGTSRRGLDWETVSGYKRGKGTLTVYGKDDARFAVPYPVLDHVGEISRILDRRIGPDGERIVSPRPTDPLLAKVHDYYGKVPPVEMEPDVTYRQGVGPKLRSEARSDLLPFGLLAAGGLVILLILLSFQIWSLPAMLLGLLLLACGLLFFLRSLSAARHAEIRLIQRDGILFGLHNGEARPLPPPQPKPGRSVYGQPATLYGKGPFAYEISMQFLEPDV